MKMSMFVKALAICGVCLSHPTSARHVVGEAVSALQEEINYLAQPENMNAPDLNSKVSQVKTILAQLVPESDYVVN